MLRALIPALISLKINSGAGSNAKALYKLMRDEGVKLVIQNGDLDYKKSPETWARQLLMSSVHSHYLSAVSCCANAKHKRLQLRSQTICATLSPEILNQLTTDGRSGAGLLTITVNVWSKQVAKLPR